MDADKAGDEDRADPPGSALSPPHCEPKTPRDPQARRQGSKNHHTPGKEPHRRSKRKDKEIRAHDAEGPKASTNQHRATGENPQGSRRAKESSKDPQAHIKTPQESKEAPGKAAESDAARQDPRRDSEDTPRVKATLNEQPSADANQSRKKSGHIGIPVPFLFPLPLSPSARQEEEEQAARLHELITEVNALTTNFRDLLINMGGSKDSQQLREDIRKTRMYALDCCKMAASLVAPNSRWQQAADPQRMAPAEMLYELMKIFLRLLNSCLFLVVKLPADMSGYDGGALSKLLVQSLRPEWNNQEEASVLLSISEVKELIQSTGIVTPGEEACLETFEVLEQGAERPLRRAHRTLHDLFKCCVRNQQEPPPPPPAPVPARSPSPSPSACDPLSPGAE